MDRTRRIWGPAVIGAALAIIGISFIQNGGNWVSAIDPSFVVHGQTGIPGGTSGGQTGGSGTIIFGQSGQPGVVTRIIPQIAVGSFDGGLTKYTTIIQIINTGTSSATLSGTFYKEEANGAAGTPFPLGFTSALTGATNPVSTFSNIVIQPNASFVLTSSSSAPGSVGWGKITSTGSISVSTVFEFRDVATNSLHSRIGVVPGGGDMSKFAIARMRNVESVFDVGFALVNTGSTNATITATLYDSNGVQVGRPQDIVVAGQGHVAKFVHQLFDLGGEPWGTNHSYVLLSSNSPQWAAMALAFEGGSINSFPVERLE